MTIRRGRNKRKSSRVGKVLVEDGKQYLKKKDEEGDQKENEVSPLTYGKIMGKENLIFNPQISN